MAPDCLSCTRFHHEDEDRDTCDAFPSGIPDAIWESRHDHRQPFDGDGGLLFEPEPGFKEADSVFYRMKMFRGEIAQ